MKILVNEKISPHKFKTPEGYLVCVDSVLARTGKQTYRRNEIFRDSDDDSEMEVDRLPEEVFSDKTLASFENKPLTLEHPDEDVNSENFKDYAVGFVRDIKRGTDNGQDVILGTLVIQDQDVIDQIENGEYTDLSCGYDCDIDDSDHPQQRNIRGNHVALCEQGRAGNARIVDSNNIKDSNIVGHSWRDLINKLSEKGYKVDSADRNNYNKFILAYKNGKTYEIEVTNYFDGDYEINSDNIYLRDSKTRDSKIKYKGFEIVSNDSTRETSYNVYNSNGTNMNAYLNSDTDLNEIKQQIDDGYLDEHVRDSKTRDSFNKKGKGFINFDDDLVGIYDENGKLLYKGLEDYDPYKYEDWSYDRSMQRYTLTHEGKTYYQLKLSDSKVKDVDPDKQIFIHAVNDLSEKGKRISYSDIIAYLRNNFSDYVTEEKMNKFRQFYRELHTKSFDSKVKDSYVMLEKYGGNYDTDSVKYEAERLGLKLENVSQSGFRTGGNYYKISGNKNSLRKFLENINFETDWPDDEIYDSVNSGGNMRDSKKINVNRLKSELQSALNNYFHNDKEWLDYSGVSVKEDNEKIVATVWAEVGYSSLMKIAKEVDRVIQKYDKDAYFDAETSGRLESYIWKNEINDSIKDDGDINYNNLWFDIKYMHSIPDVQSVLPSYIKIIETDKRLYSTDFTIKNIKTGQSISSDNMNWGRTYQERIMGAVYKLTGGSGSVKQFVSSLKDSIKDGGNMYYKISHSKPGSDVFQMVLVKANSVNEAKEKFNRSKPDNEIISIKEYDYDNDYEDLKRKGISVIDSIKDDIKNIYKLGVESDEHYFTDISVRANSEGEAKRKALENLKNYRPQDGKYINITSISGPYSDEEYKRFSSSHGGWPRYIDIKDSINDSLSIKLNKKKNDYDEYVVKVYKNGKYDEAGTYYTDDWEDAVGTLNQMARQNGLRVTQKSNSIYVADSKVKDAAYGTEFITVKDISQASLSTLVSKVKSVMGRFRYELISIKILSIDKKMKDWEVRVELAMETYEKSWSRKQASSMTVIFRPDYSVYKSLGGDIPSMKFVDEIYKKLSPYKGKEIYRNKSKSYDSKMMDMAISAIDAIQKLESSKKVKDSYQSDVEEAVKLKLELKDINKLIDKYGFNDPKVKSKKSRYDTIRKNLEKLYDKYEDKSTWYSGLKTSEFMKEVDRKANISDSKKVKDSNKDNQMTQFIKHVRQGEGWCDWDYVEYSWPEMFDEHLSINELKQLYNRNPNKNLIRIHDSKKVKDSQASEIVKELKSRFPGIKFQGMRSDKDGAKLVILEFGNNKKDSVYNYCKNVLEKKYNLITADHYRPGPDDYITLQIYQDNY